jgi:hypothetical protein
MATFDEFVVARSAMLRRLAAERSERFGRDQYGPDHDDPSMELEPVGDEVPPITLHLIYRDAKAALSGRRVTLHRLQEEPADIRASCYCHLRHTPRVFLASRIVEVVELCTGEIFEDGLVYFRQHPLLRRLTADHLASLSSLTLAMQECRDEVILLSFLAAADGEISECEEDHIVGHVLDRACDPDLSESEVRRRVREFAPDEGSFNRALARLAAGACNTKLLRWTMRKLVDADGRLDQAEADFVTEIESRLGMGSVD